MWSEIHASLTQGRLAKSKMQSGFTLIELLVVIAIIGILASLLLTNFVGIRGRAQDAKVKNDLNQLKKALRLYYNDNQNYPADNDGGGMNGCGVAGITGCTPGGEFAAGTTVYMKQLPTEFEYYSDGADKFLLVSTLQNVSDADIAASVTRCSPTDQAFYGQVVAATDYFVCED